jgi:crotonobetainyl-CoA:carnitine CoA-transferase CaiB-like acyl-CoA transferase
LSGLRIIDLSHMLAGPYCTMLLADLGAEVIKVESPQGDFIRKVGPLFGVDDEQFGGYFHSINRNKLSISLDLATEEGKQVFRDLVASADAVIENFRESVMEDLGLGYEQLREINPRIVYGCIRGFGDGRTGKSPYSDWPAYDIVAQAMGGFMSVTGEEGGEPLKAGPGIGDLYPAVLLSTGVLAAILNARETGQGQFVDVAMYDAILSLSERIVYQHSITGAIPQRQGNGHPLFSPFGVYRTSDGWATVAAPADRDWALLAEIMERPELATDPRFMTSAARVANKDEVRRVVSDWTATITTAELLEKAGGRIPVGPVQSIDEIFADPHVEAREMLVEVEHPLTDRTVRIAGTPIKFAGTPGGVRFRAPLLGEHTRSVLEGLGYSRERIAELYRDDIVK